MSASPPDAVWTPPILAVAVMASVDGIHVGGGSAGNCPRELRRYEAPGVVRMTYGKVMP